MNTTQQTLRNVVKDIVSTTIQSKVTYDWSGQDFNESVSEDIPLSEIVSVPREVELDMELFNKFTEHLTDVIISGMDVKVLGGFGMIPISHLD